MTHKPATDLQPIKASLVADLVDLINLDLSAAVRITTLTCEACSGAGVCGDEPEHSTCADCGGIGAREDFDLDLEAIKSPRIGRHVEQWELKQGRLVPKFRSKSTAFAQLTKLLGFDKAVLEVAQAASFVDTLSEAQRAQYVDQVRELALAGAL